MRTHTVPGARVVIILRKIWANVKHFEILKLRERSVIPLS